MNADLESIEILKLDTLLKLDKYLGLLLIVLLKPVTSLAGLVSQRDHDLRFEKDVTIVKPLGGGSLAIAFPTLLGLRKKYPDLDIKLVTTRKTAPFARSLNIFDEIHEINDAGIVRLAFSSLNCFFQAFGTDTVINLEAYSNLALLFALLTGARNRVGFYFKDSFWKSGVATHLFYFNSHAGTFEMYDKVFEPFGVSPVSQEECRDHLTRALPEGEEPVGHRISIGHGCSDLGKERMLTARQWEQVLTSRIDAGRETEVVFLGVEKDSALAEEIAARVSPRMPKVKFRNLCGKTSLVESLSLLRASNELWGIDSALIHFARLFGIKTLSIWGPTDPETRLRDFPGLQEEVMHKKFPCSPCVHISDSIPCRGNNICIQGLFEDKEINWIDELV